MSIQTRAIAILTKPADEWRKIASESATVEGLMREYAAPLAAIPAIAQFIGLIRFRLVAGFVYAVVSWVFALGGAWIAAVIIEKLAPTFQSKGNTEQALKLVVYSMTPIWIAGVLYLVPALAVLIILAALYAVYLFYVGLPPVMSTPSAQVIPYMVVSAVVIIIVSSVLVYITAAIFGFSAYRSF